MTTYTYKFLKIKTEELTADDMPNELFKEIFELCGADVAVSLLVNMRGNLIQVPVRGLINLEKKLICRYYEGTAASIREIQRKLGVSESYVREILKSSRIEAPSPLQISIFEDAPAPAGAGQRAKSAVKSGE